MEQTYDNDKLVEPKESDIRVYLTTLKRFAAEDTPLGNSWLTPALLAERLSTLITHYGTKIPVPLSVSTARDELTNLETEPTHKQMLEVPVTEIAPIATDNKFQAFHTIRIVADQDLVTIDFLIDSSLGDQSGKTTEQIDSLPIESITLNVNSDQIGYGQIEEASVKLSEIDELSLQESRLFSQLLRTTAGSVATYVGKQQDKLKVFEDGLTEIDLEAK